MGFDCWTLLNEVRRRSDVWKKFWITGITKKENMSAAASGQKLSRDDWRKKKELEEARKAGTAPAEVDESGK